MKFFISIFFILCTVWNVQAQNQTNETVAVRIEILSSHYAQTSQKLRNFMQNIECCVEEQRFSENETRIKVDLSKKDFDILDSLSQTLGTVNNRTEKRTNNNEKILEKQREETFLQQRKINYEQILGKIDSSSTSYLELWRELQSLENQLQDAENSLLRLQNPQQLYSVDLTLTDDVIVPTSSKVSFVNMPGFEYTVLRVENPLEDFSQHLYQGFSLKYILTRGKSFFGLGIYKNMDAVKGNEFSDMFMFSFGQDFYSRYLGRGNRTFLNPYTGYVIGYVYATGADRSENFAYIQPELGVELYKSRYIMLDCKAGYFMPIMKENKNLRGLMLSAAFNVVF
ncbi:MAG: hypothetical protein LBM68_04845 [Bacteroidales bacterium]|jgi:hypothetical protein|nr:hypothetical protein [Bacteroidales bacterium]